MPSRNSATRRPVNDGRNNGLTISLANDLAPHIPQLELNVSLHNRVTRFSLPCHSTTRLLVNRLSVQRTHLLPRRRPRPFTTLIRIISRTNRTITSRQLRHLTPITQNTTNSSLAVDLRQRHRVRHISHDPSHIRFTTSQHQISMRNRSNRFITNTNIPVLLPFMSRVRQRSHGSLNVHVTRVRSATYNSSSLSLFTVNRLTVNTTRRTVPPYSHTLIVTSHQAHFVRSHRHRHSLYHSKFSLAVLPFRSPWLGVRSTTVQEGG